MASLLDIAPSTSSAEALRVNGGKRVVVHKLNADAIAALAARFPDLLILLGSGFNFDVMRKMASAVGPIIAAGTGNLGNEQEEQAAERFIIEDQWKLISAIWRLTFPNGLSFFVEALKSLGGETGEEAKVHKFRLKKSASPLPPSSEAVSHQIM